MHPCAPANVFAVSVGSVRPTLAPHMLRSDLFTVCKEYLADNVTIVPKMTSFGVFGVTVSAL